MWLRGHDTTYVEPHSGGYNGAIAVSVAPIITAGHINHNAPTRNGLTFHSDRPTGVSQIGFAQCHK